MRRPSPNRRRVAAGTVEVIGTEGPVRPTAPCLTLPDGDGVLEGVDAELRRRERLSAVGCGRHHDHGHLPTSSRPTRCRSTSRPISPQRSRAAAATRASRGATCSTYASYSRHVTPGRPSEWSRTVPQKVTIPPHPGRTAHRHASSTGRGSPPTPTQSPLSGGVRSVRPPGPFSMFSLASVTTIPFPGASRERAVTTIIRHLAGLSTFAAFGCRSDILTARDQ